MVSVGWYLNTKNEASHVNEAILLAEKALAQNYVENSTDMSKNQWGNIEGAKIAIGNIANKPLNGENIAKVKRIIDEISQREQGQALVSIHLAILNNNNDIDKLLDQQKMLEELKNETRYAKYREQVQSELSNKLILLCVKFAKNAIQKGDFETAEKYYRALPPKGLSEKDALLKLLETSYIAAGKKSPRVIFREQIETEEKIKRAIYAQEVEKALVESMMDVYVTVSGENNEYLRLKYVLWSRPLVLKFVKDSEIVKRARSLGFKQVYFDAGPYQQHIYYDL